MTCNHQDQTLMIRQTALHLRTGALAAALLLAPGLAAAAGAVKPPRLILQITVDALRGDLPGGYAHLYGVVGPGQDRSGQ